MRAHLPFFLLLSVGSVTLGGCGGSTDGCDALCDDTGVGPRLGAAYFRVYENDKPVATDDPTGLSALGADRSVSARFPSNGDVVHRIQFYFAKTPRPGDTLSCRIAKDGALTVADGEAILSYTSPNQLLRPDRTNRCSLTVLASDASRMKGSFAFEFAAPSKGNLRGEFDVDVNHLRR